MRFARTVVCSSLLIASVAVVAGGGRPSGLPESESSDLNHINAKFLMSLDDVQKIHASKDSLGPALSGTASWRNFVGIIETRIKAAGAVDIVKNTFTFDRWSTTQFPGTSGWSLVSGGKPLRVASYGANSGSTPDAGVTADLAFVDLGMPDAATALSKMNIAGKVVVFQTVPETEKTPPSERMYEYPGDYLYLSNPETFPDPRAPTKVTRTVTMRAEMRQHTSQIENLIAGKAAGAVFVFDASYDRLAGLLYLRRPRQPPNADAVPGPLDRTSAGRRREGRKEGHAQAGRQGRAVRDLADHRLPARPPLRHRTGSADHVHDPHRWTVDLSGRWRVWIAGRRGVFRAHSPS